MLSKEAIQEYQQIYKELYGIKLPYEKALEQATQFLRLFKNVYKPIVVKGKKHGKY